MPISGSVDPGSEQSLDQIIRRHLFTQFQRLELNEPGILVGDDPEPLHAFRVALRRIRTLLSQFEKHWSEPVCLLAEDFSWLGKVTGPSRDIDVLIQGYPVTLACLSPEAARNLGLLHKHLLQLHQAQIQDLGAILSGKRYQSLKTAWRSGLTNEDLPLLKEPGRKSIRRLVSGVIGKAFDRMLIEGSAVNATSPDEEFHRLRKSCKRLRYLLEFFGEFFKGETISAIIVELKQLQDHLGRFQDLSVQPERLKAVITTWSTGGQVPVGTLIALGVLLEQLGRQQKVCRDEFGMRFNNFVSQADDHCWRDVFGKE